MSKSKHSSKSRSVSVSNSNSKNYKPKQSQKEFFQEALNNYDDFTALENRQFCNLDFKIKLKYKNTKQKDLVTTIKENRITFVNGVAGTGKTLIALKAGLELLKDGVVGNILLTTPIIEVTPKSVGALPGDLSDKIGQYFQHFYDNLLKLIEPKALKFLKEAELIEDKIINFMRGATFGRLDETGNPIGTYCIIDEAQNTTVHELKMYLSRLGENSKIIVLGDSEQCDLKLPKGESNGLKDACERFQDLKGKGVGFVEFTEDDIVRDPFLKEIMKRYKQ